MATQMHAGRIKGLLFDKDGTLVDFQASWGRWAADLMLEFAGGDAAKADRLSARIGLDRSQALFSPQSPAIAGTSADVAACLLPDLPNTSFDVLTARLDEAAQTVQPVAVVPLAQLMRRLQRSGMKLGLATNDSERPARVQLDELKISPFFDFVAGADSGYGAKPGPGMCTGFCTVTGLPPDGVAMIGDSTHDLSAGRAAGCLTVAVLSGPAQHSELSPLADVILPDIGHLPGWLGLE